MTRLVLTMEDLKQVASYHNVTDNDLLRKCFCIAGKQEARKIAYYLLLKEEAHKANLEKQIETSLYPELSLFDELEDSKCYVKALQEIAFVNEQEARHIALMACYFVNEKPIIRKTENNGFSKNFNALLKREVVAIAYNIDIIIECNMALLKANEQEAAKIKERQKEAYIRCRNRINDFSATVLGFRYDLKQNDVMSIVNGNYRNSIVSDNSGKKRVHTTESLNKIIDDILKAIGNSLYNRETVAMPNKEAQKAISKQLEEEATKKRLEEKRKQKEEEEARKQAETRKKQEEAEAREKARIEKLKTEAAEKQAEAEAREQKIETNKAFTEWLKAEGFTNAKQIVKIAKGYTDECKKAILAE